MEFTIEKVEKSWMILNYPNNAQEQQEANKYLMEFKVYIILILIFRKALKSLIYVHNL